MLIWGLHEGLVETLEAASLPVLSWGWGQQWWSQRWFQRFVPAAISPGLQQCKVHREGSGDMTVVSLSWVFFFTYCNMVMLQQRAPTCREKKSVPNGFQVSKFVRNNLPCINLQHDCHIKLWPFPFWFQKLQNSIPLECGRWMSPGRRHQAAYASPFKTRVLAWRPKCCRRSLSPSWLRMNDCFCRPKSSWWFWLGGPEGQNYHIMLIYVDMLFWNDFIRFDHCDLMWITIGHRLGTRILQNHERGKELDLVWQLLGPKWSVNIE